MSQCESWNRCFSLQDHLIEIRLRKDQTLGDTPGLDSRCSGQELDQGFEDTENFWGSSALLAHGCCSFHLKEHLKRVSYSTQVSLRKGAEGGDDW